MKINCFVAVLVGFSVLLGSVAVHADDLATDYKLAIDAAEEQVEQARIAIGNGKELLALIPGDSPLMIDVAQVIKVASDNWAIATESLEEAKLSASKIATTDNESVANAYVLLVKVNAGVALSGAKVVQIGMAYVDAVANNKTEALDIIRTAMQDAASAASLVQSNDEILKKLIAEKYSK